MAGLRTLHVARRGRRGSHFLLYRTASNGTIEIVCILHDGIDCTPSTGKAWGGADGKTAGPAAEGLAILGQGESQVAACRFGPPCGYEAELTSISMT